jgi:hypothetical protein
MTIHNTHNKHPCPGGIRTYNLSRRAAVDLRLRRRGHWDPHIYDNISLNSSYNKKISDTICRENKSTHFCSITFISEHRVVYEIMWKNLVQSDRPQMIIWRMLFACLVTKAICTHSDYVILITFPLHHWLHKRA